MAQSFFIGDDMYAEPSQYQKGSFSLDANILCAYFAFFTGWALVYQSFSDLGLATFLTLAVAFQCLGLMCLCIKISKEQSVLGISGHAMILQSISYVLKLCCMVWLKGYIPDDETGDWLYQMLHVVAFFMSLHMSSCIFRTHRCTYQEGLDTFRALPLALGCICSAALVHPDLHSRPLFDTAHTAALYIDMVSMIPQLGMIMRESSVECLTSHFIFSIAMSRASSLAFWYHAYTELAPLEGGFNIAGYAVLGTQLAGLLLLCDFVFYYIRAWVSHSCQQRMQVGGPCDY
eukprot:gnl/MRDRNA2_/MRDRNA2_25132_c0_seq1.p1 gnl/MRDRNA2_/MRDRNA2_25132_c0~~gnl/MRDRNA2_/MRDRNA2_25132_c0_seq1.p1  ORF type:complete len:289 (-),score=24.00 gnl/MRDRNA2_/MRDRNA2_25132_c0_seq1:6-872(-)